MEQLVARRAHNPKATGSSPVPATIRTAIEKSVAVFGLKRFFQELIPSHRVHHFLNFLHQLCIGISVVINRYRKGNIFPAF